MNRYSWTLSFVAGALLAATGGCTRNEAGQKDALALKAEKELGPRIGSVAVVPGTEEMRVEGYGLVVGLAGTGSADCPPEVRKYLKRYVALQVPGGSNYNVDELINSKNTAVVRLDAVTSAVVSKDDHFDVRVSLQANSDASSLQGGRLFKAELKSQGTVGMATRVSGTVEGMVFIDTLSENRPDLRSGYVLGGGRVGYDYQGGIALRKADFVLAGRIRDRLNSRYGPGTSEAVSPSLVVVRIPSVYRQRKLRFLEMVDATYLDQTPELADARADFYVRRLAASDQKERSEIALEALGSQCLGKVASLLQSSDEEVRLRAARCALNLGDDRAFGVLREIALDVKSLRRVEALEAIVLGAQRNDAMVLAERLLQDRDPVVMRGAYEQLRRMRGSAIDQVRVAGDFYIEQVAQAGQKAIYVTRSGQPRIVLFGTPLICGDNLFVQSRDKKVVINAQPGQGFVSLMREQATGAGMVGPIRSGFDLADIVQTLGEDPARTRGSRLSGLGVPYSDIVALVEQLAAKGGVQAEFWAGPLPK